MWGSLVFGDYSHITFYKEAIFDSNSYKDYGHNSTVIYKGVTVHGGDTDVPSNSTVCYEDSVIFISGANCTFRSDVTVTYHKPCVIDSGAVVNYTHDVTSFHKGDFIVHGKFWADNSILDFGDDSTTAPGVVFEGEGASLSRITDSMIKDGVDGFTITNASPLIKTSEVLNVTKRGFNISGIDAEPEVRKCYVHNCGTYPVQVLYEADPVVVDSRLYGGSKTAARIWGADGEYSRNEFRSEQGSGAFLFSSSANPRFYSFADSGGNVFDMDNIGAHGVFIGGGFPEFGHNSYYNGYNSFQNKGGKYYFYNDTPGTILAELNWWPDGTSFYNADGGSIDFQPRLLEEPPSGPLAKTAVSPYSTGFEKFREKDYENAMTELKEAIKQDKNSLGADKAVFQLAKSARKIGRLAELEPLLVELQKETDPQVQYHSRNWLCYLYASQNKMNKAEKLASEAPAGSSLERTLLLDICSYYAAWKDTDNAVRIADILKSRHSDEALEMELEAALEGYVDFQQVRGHTKIKRPVIDPALEPEPEVAVEADTVQFKTGIFPNPFNASTTVHFNLKDEGHVSIVVYDLLGRKVKTLVEENRSTGAHRVIWDGRDESGMTASSGIYFVRIQTRETARTFKISYLK
ncbi:T9SS type A sorting domain-containing protein [candidate division KSB1 bacterium]|nr:T9SS type A sorting domain-containing protein [candidate division KSB1 bacterium]